MNNTVLKYPRFRWFMLVAASFSFISLNMNMVSFSPILGKIADDLGVSTGSATQLITAFQFSSAIAMVLGGILCDRFGVLPLLIIGNLCGAIPAVFMPLFHSYDAVFWARFCQGLAVGFCVSTMSSITAIWFPLKERGLVAGLMGTAIGLGGTVGMIISPMIYVATGNSWQLMASWLSVVGWVALLLAIIALVILKAAPALNKLQASCKNIESSGSFRQIIFMPSVWIGVALTFFAIWCMQTLNNIPPSYMQVKPEGLGLDPVLAGRIGSSIGLAGIIAPVIGGVLQDKVFKMNSKPMMYTGFVLFFIFSYMILLPFIYTKHSLLVTALFLAGSGVAVIVPAIVLYISGAYPVSSVGKILGLWMGVGNFGGAVGLFLCGITITKFGNYTWAVTLIALAGIIGFFCALVLPKNKVTANSDPDIKML